MTIRHGRILWRLLVAAVLVSFAAGCRFGAQPNPEGSSNNSAGVPDPNAWSSPDIWPEAQYVSIDAKAAAIDGSSIAAVAQSLAATATSDQQKARAIYTWVATHIAYDAEAFLNNSATAQSQLPSVVFSSRKAVCSGYADLYHTLCVDAGVTCRTVVGYAKGYGYQTGDHFTGTNHAWNVVDLDGSTYIVDTTWGAGYLDQNGAFVFSFTGFWFEPNPYLSLYSHLPQYPADQTIPDPITLDAFERLPYSVATNAETLYDLGFDQDSIASRISSGAGVPTAYRLPGIKIRVLQAPLSSSISQGVLAEFGFSAPPETSGYLTSDTNSVPMERKDNSLRGSIVSSGAALNVGFGSTGSSSYYIALQYGTASTPESVSRPMWDSNRAALRPPAPIAIRAR